MVKISVCVKKQKSAENMKTTVIIFLTILVLAAFLRVYNLDWETLTYGEVEIWQAANEYLKGNFINNFYNFDTPPLFKYLVALSLLSFGFSEFTMRVVSAIFGILTVFLTFLFAKKFYSDEVALLSSTLVAFSFILIEFSRYALYDSPIPFFFLLAAYFFLSKSKKSWLYLGISLGLGMLTKFTMLFMVIAILLFVFLPKNSFLKHIKLKKYERKRKFINSIFVMIIIFFIFWPFSLFSIPIKINYSVPGFTGIGSGEATLNLPIFLLSIGKRFLTSSECVTLNTFEDIPFLNYIFLFFVKENPLLIIIILFGLSYSLKKGLDENDRFLLFTTLIVFILLVLQRWNYSPRHMMMVIPFLSIVSSKFITRFYENYKQIVFGFVLILFLSSLFAFPSFTLYTSPVSIFTGEPKPKFLSEGMKELFISTENCTSVYAEPGIVFKSLPYTKKFSNNVTSFDCLVSSNNLTNLTIPKQCKLWRTISKNNIELMRLYRC